MRSVAFSTDGLMMAAGGDPRNVTLWAMESWKVTMTMTGHPLTVRSVAFSPDFKIIATACDDEQSTALGHCYRPAMLRTSGA